MRPRLSWVVEWRFDCTWAACEFDVNQTEEVTMQQNLWRVGTFGAVACAVAIGVAAQTANPPQTPPPSSSQTKSMDNKDKVTVTGCVQRADTAAPTGTSGSTAAASSASKFILANAKSESSGSSATAGTSGSASSATATSYKLDADDAKLTPHVGHKVEISGTVEPASSAASSSMSSPTLKVDSVKMIASTCSN